jgi:hypothetical protein
MRRTGRLTSTWMPRRTERIRRSRSSLRLRAHTAGEVGFGGAHTAAEPYRITDEPCGERTSILPVEPECGNEQLGPPTDIWWCAGYIPTHCVTVRRTGRPCTTRSHGVDAWRPERDPVRAGSRAARMPWTGVSCAVCATGMRSTVHGHRPSLRHLPAPSLRHLPAPSLRHGQAINLARPGPAA